MSWKDKFPKESRYFETDNGILYCVNVLEILSKFPNEGVDCIITSPPYWGLRDYQVEDQIGLESSLEEYIEKLFEVMKELKRILKKTGVIFWNHGDCYGANESRRDIVSGMLGGKRKKRTPVYKRPNIILQKCMALQNYRFILRCVDELKLILRNIIIWYKPNHMPSSVKDRFTNAYEPIFMLVKNKKYWFDLDAVRVPHKPQSIERYKRKYEGNYNKNPQTAIGVKPADPNRELNPLGKNPGDLWEIPTQPFSESHFATFPEKLVEPMIKCACPQWEGIVLDPFMGSGTVAVVAERLNRRWVGIEINSEYCEMAKKRILKEARQLKFNFKT